MRKRCPVAENRVKSWRERERERESDTAGTSIERNHVEPRAGDEGKEEFLASACTQLHMANFIAQAQAER